MTLSGPVRLYSETYRLHVGLDEPQGTNCASSQACVIIEKVIDMCTASLGPDLDNDPDVTCQACCNLKTGAAHLARSAYRSRGLLIRSDK